MQRYRRTCHAQLLAVLAVASLACEDRPATPLEPSERPSLSVTGDGWTTIDGIDFYEYEGVPYPLEGVSAQIWDPKTTGDIWPYGGSVMASFDFRGSGATQSTSWELRRYSTGERIAGATAANHGGTWGGVTTVVRRTFSGAFAIDHPYECDLELTASSDHSAWWIGVVVDATPPYIKLGTWGLKRAFSMMGNRIRECGTTDEYDGGGDGGGGDDECGGDVCDEELPSTCTNCQQWLHYSTSGEYLYDTWECTTISASECLELVS